MGTGTGPMIESSATASGESSDETARLATDIAHTREEMSETIEQIHGRLNPTVLKDEAIRSFHEAKEAIKEEVKTELSEAKERLKEEFAETKEQVKAELAEAKNALREATIGKVETMVHNTQETVKATGRSLSHTVRENPLPVALIGAGLVWLYASSRSKNSHTYSGQEYLGQGYYGRGVGQGYYGGATYGRNSGYAGYAGQESERSEREGGVLQGAGQMAQRAAAAVSGVTHSAGESISGLASSAKASVTNAAQMTREQLAHAAQATQGQLSHAAQVTQEQLAHLAQTAAMQGRKLGHQAEDTYASNPLAVAAALFAVGAAVGFSLPITRREDQLMGSARDEVLHRAAELAHEATDKVGEAAKQAVETVKSSGKEAIESLQSQGGASAGSAVGSGKGNGHGISGQSRGATGHHPQGSING